MTNGSTLLAQDILGGTWRRRFLWLQTAIGVRSWGKLGSGGETVVQELLRVLTAEALTPGPSPVSGRGESGRPAGWESHVSGGARCRGNFSWGNTNLR